MYSWCANNSVDWSLVCSSPSRFEGKLWTVYEEKRCDDDHTNVKNNTTNDDYDGYTDVKNNTTNDDILSKRTDDKNNTQWPSGPAPTRIQEGIMQNNSVYFYCIIISLSVVILCLLTITVLLCWRIIIRTGRTNLDVEYSSLSSVPR
jgi:hypothetical protein